MGPEAAEIIKEKDDFSDPEFYLDVFQGCLERISPENSKLEQFSSTDILTILSLYSQAMKSEISQLLDEEIKLEIDSFINYSRQDRFKDLMPNTPGDRERMQSYIEKIVESLGNL